MGCSHTIGRLDPSNAGGAVERGSPSPTLPCLPIRIIGLNEWIVDLSIGGITFLNTDAVLAFEDLENCDFVGGVNHLPLGIDPSVCHVILPDGTNVGPFPDSRN
eukprot:scaffold278_cov195-Amphora_coffeaeformis.AAC.23